MPALGSASVPTLVSLGVVSALWAVVLVFAWNAGDWNKAWGLASWAGGGRDWNGAGDPV